MERLCIYDTNISFSEFLFAVTWEEDSYYRSFGFGKGV